MGMYKSSEPELKNTIETNILVMLAMYSNHFKMLPLSGPLQKKISNKIVTAQLNSTQLRLVKTHYWYVTHPPPTKYF
jgi:hypothetical protein